MSAIPQTHRALTVIWDPEPRVEVQQRALPDVKDDEVLVKVKAVSVNPYAAFSSTTTYLAETELPFTYTGLTGSIYTTGDFSQPAIP